VAMRSGSRVTPPAAISGAWQTRGVGPVANGRCGVGQTVPRLVCTVDRWCVKVGATQRWVLGLRRVIGWLAGAEVVLLLV
jgi:hypothetical protein